MKLQILEVLGPYLMPTALPIQVLAPFYVF